jgi:hypothetical protein
MGKLPCREIVASVAVVVGFENHGWHGRQIVFAPFRANAPKRLDTMAAFECICRAGAPACYRLAPAGGSACPTISSSAMVFLDGLWTLWLRWGVAVL